MALAQINEITTKKLVQRSADLGEFLLAALQSLHPRVMNLKLSTRVLGLLAGVELRLADGSPATSRALAAIKTMLHRGFILLPEGEHSNVISFTPPLTISKDQLARTVEALGEILAADGRR